MDHDDWGANPTSSTLRFHSIVITLESGSWSRETALCPNFPPHSGEATQGVVPPVPVRCGRRGRRLLPGVASPAIAGRSNGRGRASLAPTDPAPCSASTDGRSAPIAARRWEADAAEQAHGHSAFGFASEGHRLPKDQPAPFLSGDLSRPSSIASPLLPADQDDHRHPRSLAARLCGGNLCDRAGVCQRASPRSRVPGLSRTRRRDTRLAEWPPGAGGFQEARAAPPCSHLPRLAWIIHVCRNKIARNVAGTAQTRRWQFTRNHPCEVVFRSRS